MAGNDAIGMSGIEQAFARYQRLDAEELEAAASEAQDRAAIIEGATAPARRRGRVRRARPDERQVESAIIEDGAAAWAEALMRARESREGDIAGIALGRALDGDASGFEEAVESAHAISKPELDAQIASADMLRNLLGAAGMATFRLDSAHPLAVAQHMASTAAKSVYTALRAELAERLSLADGGANTKSSRNRARRAREWAGEVEPARTSFRAAALSLPQLDWAQGAGRPGAWEDPRAARIDDEPETERGSDADARTDEAAVEEPRKGAFAILDDQALAAAIRNHEEHLAEVAISVEALESLGRSDEAGRSRAHARFAEANLEMMREEAEERGIALPPAPELKVQTEGKRKEAGIEAKTDAVNERHAGSIDAKEPFDRSQAKAKDDFARSTFPAKWIHPYVTKPNAAGKVFDKAIVNIPSGCKIDGESLDGYSVDLFLQDFHMQAIKDGKPVTFRFKKDEDIRLFADGKPDINVNPWVLAKAVKEGRESYRKRRGASTPGNESREQARQKRNLVGITFPPGCAQLPYTVTGKDGRKWMKTSVRIPDGAMLSDRPLDGYSVSLFCKEFHVEAIRKGEKVSFKLDEGGKLTLFADGKDDIECSPWELTRAVKAAREAGASPSVPPAMEISSPERDAARLQEAPRARNADPQKTRSRNA